MHTTDFNEPELTGGNPAEEHTGQAAHMQPPHAGSCLPSPGVFLRKGGTALLDLESTIRDLLETGGQSVHSLNDMKNKICGTRQEHEIDLLAVSKGHKAR